MACTRGRLEIAKFLVQRGAEINRHDSRGNTPLILACARGHLDTAKFLIEQGANMNYEDPYAATALTRAIQLDQPSVAEYLVAHGANVNVSFANGRNALRVACEHGNVSLVRALIEKGADLSATNAAAALIEAATEGRTEVVSLLVQKAAPLDLQNEEGWTALMKSAALGHPKTVQTLCDAGADPSKRNRFERTALDYARGIPGTEGLATGEEIGKAQEKGGFHQDELFYVLARRQAGCGPKYDRIAKMLEEYETRFHNKTDAGDGK